MNISGFSSIELDYSSIYDLESHGEGVIEEENNNIIPSIIKEDSMLSEETNKLSKETSKKSDKDKNPVQIKTYENRHQRKGKRGHKLMPT